MWWENYYNRTDDNTNYEVRREIVLSHLNPDSVETIGVCGNVSLGTLVGYLCRHDRRDMCGISITTDPRDFEVNHLAFQVRFYGVYFEANLQKKWTEGAKAEELIGVLATPNCIFDEWAEDHITRQQKVPGDPGLIWLVNWFAACPQ